MIHQKLTIVIFLNRFIYLLNDFDYLLRVWAGLHGDFEHPLHVFDYQSNEFYKPHTGFSYLHYNMAHGLSTFDCLLTGFVN